MADQQQKHGESAEPAAELQRLARLLTKGAASESRDDKAYVPSYGNLADINTCRLLARAVPAELFTEIVEDCVRPLDTSAAVCEKNGDYALGIFSSDWCRLLDQASRELCGTDDNIEALGSGKWLCHESCWTQASKVCIETGQPVDIECHGGIRLFAAPIRAGDEIVGCMNFGYGDPPRASDKLQEIASKYRVGVDELRGAADSYESRPTFLIDVAKNRVLSSAKLIGEMVEHKRAEEQLRRLATVLMDSNDAITVQKLDGTILAWNRGAERIYGYTEQEALGMNVRELVPEPQRAEADHSIDQMRSGDLAESLETQRQTKDGRILDVWLTLTALTDETGKPTGVATTERDITERKRMEERSSRQAALLQAMNDVFREALTCKTEESLGKTCLAVAQKLTGSKFGFLAELNPAGLIDDIATSHPGWGACEMAVSDARRSSKDMPIRGIARSLIGEGKSRIVNADEMATHPDRVGTPDGHPPITTFLGVPLKHQGESIGMIGLGNKESGYETADQEAVESLGTAIVEALTNKRAEQRIQVLNAELEQRILELSALNKELESFSYSVSHDLRAPLRGIDGFSRMLLEDQADQLGTEGKRRLNVIRSSAEQMAHLIDDLLTFSRLGRKHMSSSRINMSALAQEVFEQIQRDELDRTVHLRIGALPHAVGDRTMIREVLWNLLSNAVKFTRPRKVPVIELTGEVRADENAYSVKDNGVGFNMKYADKLFQVFQRLHDAEEFEGTGIGLALVQRVVQRHSGRVWAETKPGEGATFFFTLPRRKESQDA